MRPQPTCSIAKKKRVFLSCAACQKSNQSLTNARLTSYRRVHTTVPVGSDTTSRELSPAIVLQLPISLFVAATCPCHCYAKSGRMPRTQNRPKTTSIPQPCHPEQRSFTKTPHTTVQTRCLRPASALYETPRDRQYKPAASAALPEISQRRPGVSETAQPATPRRQRGRSGVNQDQHDALPK